MSKEKACPAKVQITNVDWVLLRKQKEWLAAISRKHYAVRRKTHSYADGLLNLIDHIQDAAVMQGVPEAEVYTSEQKEKPDGNQT
jgi:hypothetical protein